MRFGLKEDSIQKICAVLARYPQVDQAILLGEIDDLLLPYTFDLSIFHQICDPDVLDHIQRVDKVFYEKAAEKTLG